MGGHVNNYYGVVRPADGKGILKRHIFCSKFLRSILYCCQTVMKRTKWCDLIIPVDLIILDISHVFFMVCQTETKSEQNEVILPLDPTTLCNPCIFGGSLFFLIWWAYLRKPISSVLTCKLFSAIFYNGRSVQSRSCFGPVSLRSALCLFLLTYDWRHKNCVKNITECRALKSKGQHVSKAEHDSHNVARCFLSMVRDKIVAFIANEEVQ